MAECCESADTPPSKYRCPVNGKEYGKVGIKTIIHHLARPWTKKLGNNNYYYCSDTECEVVYFAQDDSVIRKSELRTSVGIKERTPDGTLCYCFGVTYADAKQNSKIIDFVSDKTRRALCSCETSNPSGRCCLKDFPTQ